MNRYARLVTLSVVAVITLLAITVFAYAAKDVLAAEGVVVDQTVFAVLVVAVLLGVYLYFVKLARRELKRLNEQAVQLPPDAQ
jgi:divalent metal cation (Fe/Co/Zn/Cd) transporter